MKAVVKTDDAKTFVRGLLKSEEVIKNLYPAELEMISSAATCQIREYSMKAIQAYLSQLLAKVIICLGLSEPDKAEYKLQCETISEMLFKYFSQYTLADVKLSFEMMAAGRLDNYIHGGKKNAQKLNCDYVARVMNAYAKALNDAIAKALRLMPESGNEISEEEKRFYINRINANIRNIFLKFKYTGKLETKYNETYYIYKWLIDSGFAVAELPMEKEKQEAYTRYMQRASRGIINKYTAFAVKKTGYGAKELQPAAEAIARRRIIINAFTDMVEDEVQIDDYIKFI